MGVRLPVYLLVLITAGFAFCADQTPLPPSPKLARARAEGAPTIDASAFFSSKWDNEAVRIVGRVRDVVSDELNTRYHFILLETDYRTIYCPIADLSEDQILSILHAEVSVLGLIDSYSPPAGRRTLGSRIFVERFSDITILTPPPSDPFAAERTLDWRYGRLFSLHFRERSKMFGKVLASWNRTHLLLRRENGLLAKVETLKEAPHAGEWIEVVGSTETDFFNVNLLQAIWRTCKPMTNFIESVTDVSAKAILENEEGRREVKSELQGEVIRLTGIVRSLPGSGESSGVVGLEENGYLTPVNVSSAPAAVRELEIGCRVAATGVCVMDIDNWYPNAPFPRIRGFFVVLRTPDDLVVLERPPWWTPRRLGIALGLVLAALVAVLLWNKSLRTLAERRGRELFRRQIEKASADLKVEERTRLAVELHDSLAQTLTGVAMEIETAGQFAEGAGADLVRHLDTAAKALDSSRAELRNCLWDLRSAALEEPDMTTAIRRTLLPHCKNVTLLVRFNVPRSRFSDNTAYAILRIIRELALNGIRHGRADTIRVAGGLDGDTLLFSVRDNGCGFDPDAAPGVLSGHFGIQGVRERLLNLGGSLAYESAPGKGTKATVTIRIKS